MNIAKDFDVFYLWVNDNDDKNADATITIPRHFTGTADLLELYSFEIKYFRFC